MTLRTLILIGIIFPLGLQAQFITLSGKVQDAKTKELLPFASVAIKGSPVGTIVNAEGKFTLHIPKKFENDTLCITSIGYQTLLIPLSKQLSSSPSVFSLQPTFYNLAEVVVTDSITVKSILRRAYQNLKDNYPFQPFSLKGFYREIQKADTQYVSLLEASVKLYSDGYKTNRTERIQVEQLRRSLTYEHPLVSFWNTKNLLFHHIHQNFVKYAKKQLLKYDKATRMADTSIGNTPVYVISLEKKGWFWPAILYIREDNYAIIRAEEDFMASRDGVRSWKVDGAPLVTSYPQRKLLRVDFKEYRGKYYVSNHYLEFTTQYKSTLTKEDFLLYSIVQQFAVTDVDQIPQPIAAEVALKETETLQNLTLPYDSAFWKNYNVITDTALDSIVRNDLERRLRVGQH